MVRRSFPTSTTTFAWRLMRTCLVRLYEGEFARALLIAARIRSLSRSNLTLDDCRVLEKDSENAPDAEVWMSLARARQPTTARESLMAETRH